MGADNSFYIKTIETHAGAFFKVIIFSIGSVIYEGLSKSYSMFYILILKL